MFSFTRLSCVLHVSVYVKTIFRYKSTELNIRKITSKYVAGTAAPFYECFHLQSCNMTIQISIYIVIILHLCTYEGWNFNSGNYLFTNDTK